MSLDITPVIPKGRQLIQSYGDGGFRVADVNYTGSILVFPERVIGWPVNKPEDITLDSLKDATDSEAEIMLIGCGPDFLPPPAGLREGLKALGAALEWMDTGAACRTSNILLAEDRAFAAALVAVE